MLDALDSFLDARTRAALTGDVASGCVINGSLVSASPAGLSSFQSNSGPFVATTALLAVLSGTQPLHTLTPSAGTAALLGVASVLSSASAGFGIGTAPAAPVDPGADVIAEGVLVNHESLVRELITLLKSEARHRAIRSLGVRISRFEDPEEGDIEAVVTQTVDASPEEALAYWDEVGRSIQSWAATLSDDDARFLLERIAVNIDWNNADNSAVRPG